MSPTIDAFEIEVGTDSLVNDVSVPVDVMNENDEINLSPQSIRERNHHKSEIETLARTIDDRRNNRMKVTFLERQRFLDICLEASKKEGGSLSRFSKKGLECLVEEFRKRVTERPKAFGLYDKLLNLIGCWDSDNSMLRIFEAGLKYTENSEENEFYFRDFNFYCTVLASKFTFMRIPCVFITFWLLLFYLGSAILFCGIMKDENVCPAKTSEYGYDGWVTSIYFASVTMSTVGYGDVSLYNYGQNSWVTFIAILYMLVAMAIAFTVFTSAATMTFDGIFSLDMLASFKPGIKESKEIPLYKQVRRLVLLRVVELLFYFVALNSIGVFAARGFVYYSDVPDQQWDWMTTIYWAVQTTTTIGYGDLDMPFDLRWFNIFFATFGTAFVGSVFGSLAGLQDEINDHRRYYAWRRREMSKMMIDELQINDDKLDQYEFVLGSLLLLNKVKTNDIDQIMDKFRELAGDKRYICISDETDKEHTSMIESKNGGVSKKTGDFIDFK